MEFQEWLISRLEHSADFKLLVFAMVCLIVAAARISASEIMCYTYGWFPFVVGILPVGLIVAFVVVLVYAYRKDMKRLEAAKCKSKSI